MVNHVHIRRRDAELTDTDSLVNAHLNRVVHIQLPIVFKVRVKGESQKASFITFPWRCQYSLCDV